MSSEKDYYTKLLDDVDAQSEKNTIKQSFWLIYAESAAEYVFTSGNLEGFEKYSPIIAYNEELKIVNRQLFGERGMYAANLIVRMPRNAVSVAFFNKFSSKSIMNKVKIVEVVENSGTLSARQTITYSTCKIEEYKNLMDKIEIHVNYSSRQDSIVSYNSNGSKMGNTIGNIKY